MSLLGCGRPGDVRLTAQYSTPAEGELILEQSRSEAEPEACFRSRKVMARTLGVQIESLGQ